MADSYIYSQAKVEYTKQLIDVLKDRLYDGINELFIESKRSIKEFRINLENVIKWNQEMIELERSKIVERSKCEYIDDLITAVFISHTRILTSIGKNYNKKVNLVVPKTINFIHKCYINIAREIWKNPNLYDNRITSSEYQKNIRIIENIIRESIEYTIRTCLPVKDILKNHMIISNEKDSQNYETDSSNIDTHIDTDKNDDYIDNTNYDEYSKKNTIIKDIQNNYQEERYDNDEIIISDDEEDKINSILKKDEDKEDLMNDIINDNNNKSIIEQINNINYDDKEENNTDIINEDNIETETYNDNKISENNTDIDMFKNIGIVKDDSDDEQDTKIISDLERKTDNNVKDIKKINNDIQDDDVIIINDKNNDLNDVNTIDQIDDTETVDGILDDIDKLNNNNDYTLFE